MSARSLLAIRVVLLALAGGACAAAEWLGHVRGATVTSRFVCPMHPDVEASRPGACPICRMQLEPAAARDPPLEPSTFRVYDFVRRRGFGQEVRGAAHVEDDGAVTALVYKDILPTLTADEKGVFSPSAAPAASYEVHPCPESATAWDRSTARVRFRADASSRALRAGDVGWLRLAAKPREATAVPYSAILEDANGPYVLVASGDGRALARRSIEVGRVVGGAAIVLSGLRLRERVLVEGAFFVDAERELHHEASLELSP
ncbi:MAG TPA: heavy metal-binding domain-containing protein [Polyangiaceae bacterium]|nr:heavy metal-binding domain-containing protein [Polyangiaceae bacterium]